METIHFKTVDPVSQELLRGASERGVELNWERYEKQQPQDGFLRLGLSCPYGCMQGPCRIDPYGRGAERGVCGLDRDAMAAAFLLRLTLQGLWEGLDLSGASRRGIEIAWPAPLEKAAATAQSTIGGAPLTAAEIGESAALLSRPSADAETLVRQALRLGLLAIGSAKRGKSPSTLGYRVGYGLLAKEAVTVAVAGKIPEILAKALLKAAAGMKNPKARLVSLGGWLPAGKSFLPIVCTTGEAETVVASGRINLLLTGPGCDPGLTALAASMHIPVLKGEAAPAAEEVFAQACKAFDRRDPVLFTPDAALIGAGSVAIGSAEVQAALKGAASPKLTLVGGSDTLFQSFGHLPVELAKALIGEGCAVASWGDAALWMAKQEIPATLLDSQDGPLAAVCALAAAGTLTDLKGICFTGLRSCRELTLALGLAALGLKVAVAVPLPLWGSAAVRTALRTNLAAAGGTLTHYDHPAQGEELLSWFVRA
ncbi:MAG: hypothetical protein ACYC7J_02900 [Syntrophales bacterium]